MKEIDLGLPMASVKVALIAGRFNQFVTDELIAGALDALQRNGVEGDSVTVIWVPGAFEIPLAADRAFDSGSFDAVIGLGAVIRGGTAHFEYVAGECARGLCTVGLKYGKPAIFGVLTTDTIEQAMERAATDRGNKGFDCAMAGLQMLGLQEQLISL
jgi:6,7-dimethyl-8-ribityllumazine synthase